MATYHFHIKNDKKPDGTKISAVTHAEYIGREGKFSDIDCGDMLWQSLAGNVITSEKVRDAFDGRYIPLYYTDDFGSIANTLHGITLTENPSLETIAIALSLADEAMAHQPLIVQGSEKFKGRVMEAAVLSELNIAFADAFMQQEFQQKLEEAKDELRRFRERGGKFLHLRHVPKSHPQSLADPSLQALADTGFRLPTLSQCTLVPPEPTDAGLLLSGDEAGELVNTGKQPYRHVRWHVGRERRRLARATARKILQSTEDIWISFPLPLMWSTSTVKGHSPIEAGAFTKAIDCRNGRRIAPRSSLPPPTDMRALGIADIGKSSFPCQTN